MALPWHGDRLAAIQRLPGRFTSWLLARDSDGASGEILRRSVQLSLMLFGAGMAAISLFGDQGLLAYLELRDEATRLKQEMAALEEHHEELQETIRALGEDPAYLEYLARRDLGLVRPGEVLVELPVPRPDGAPPSLKTLPGIDPATKDIPTPGR